jgi:hypothetical protein
MDEEPKNIAVLLVAGLGTFALYAAIAYFYGL